MRTAYPVKAFDYVSGLTILSHIAMLQNNGDFFFDMKEFLYTSRIVVPEKILPFEKFRQIENVSQATYDFYHWLIKPYHEKSLSLQSLKGKILKKETIYSEKIKTTIQQFHKSFKNEPLTPEEVISVIFLFGINPGNLCQKFLGITPVNETFLISAKINTEKSEEEKNVLVLLTPNEPWKPLGFTYEMFAVDPNDYLPICEQQKVYILNLISNVL